MNYAGIYDSAHLIFHGPSVRRKIGVSFIFARFEESSRVRAHNIELPKDSESWNRSAQIPLTRTTHILCILEINYILKNIVKYLVRQELLQPYQPDRIVHRGIS